MWRGNAFTFSQSCDWLCSFQTVNPADGCCVAIGFLPSSSGAVGHFRLHDDERHWHKKRRKTQGKLISWREQRKFNLTELFTVKEATEVKTDVSSGRLYNAATPEYLEFIVLLRLLPPAELFLFSYKLTDVSQRWMQHLCMCVLSPQFSEQLE